MDRLEGYAAEGLELLDVGVAIFDRDTRLVFANRAFRALRRYPDDVCREGVTLEALLRFNAERGDFGPGDVEAQVAERLAEIEETEEREIEREMADGQILRIRYRRTGSGGLVVTFDDRTAERRAQAALALSEERHKLVIQATSDFIYDWNVTDDVLYSSEILTRQFEIDVRDKASSAWNERVHEEDYERYIAAIRAHFRGETEALECEYRVRGKGSAYRWVQDRGIGVRDKDGRVTRLVGAVRDITEMKEAKAELDRTEARLMSSLATISDGILLVDSDNRVQLWNDRYIEIFSEAVGGVDLTEVIVKGRPFFEMIRDGYNLGMFKPHPDGVEAWVAARTQAWEQPASQWELELANGVWLLLNERRMPDGGRVSVYTDITELKRREGEEQAARERFEEAIEAISSGFVLFDADDRLVIWNSRFGEHFSEVADVITPGVPFSDILTASIERGLFPGAGDDPERFLATLLEKRAKGVGQVRENLLSNGMWLQITDHRTKDGGLVSISTDITELKTSEQDAQAARERFEEAIEAISSGFTLWDRDDRLVICNSRYREYFPDLADMVTPGTLFRDIITAAIERGLFPGAEKNPEVFLDATARKRARADGDIREQHLAGGLWLQISDHRTKDGGIVSIYTDVSELKNREAELRKQSAILEATMENMGQGITMVDKDLNTVAFNKKFLEMFEFPEDEFGRGFSMDQAFRLNAERGEYGPGDVEEQVRERMELSRKFLPHRFERTRPDGTVVEIVGNPVEGGGFVSTYTDITERKEREAEITRARDAAEAALADLQKAQQRLIQAEKMASLGQLTAGIAHEIKNPLNFVNNFAKLSDELLAELGEILEAPIAALDAEARDDAEDLFRTVRENLGKINQHGKRADSIVKNMLLHSREGPSEQQVVNLNAIAEEALGLAYHGARAEHPGFNIELVKSLDPDLGEVECFPQDLMRVFLNLITNGMYAANKRGADAEDGFSPTISLTTRAKGDRIEIEVRDNGAGIAPDVLDKIFIPFFTTKPAGEGTGLGLSLSYDIVVKQHGGELTVDSQPGEFTAFRVTIPRTLARNLAASGGNHR